MHATPFDRLHWNARQLADAVPLRLHQIDLFDAASGGRAARVANAPRLAPAPRLRRGYLAAAALPARFHVH